MAAKSNKTTALHNRTANQNRATKDIDDPRWQDVMNRDKLLGDAISILEDNFHGEDWRRARDRFLRAAKRLTKA